MKETKNAKALPIRLIHLATIVLLVLLDQFTKFLARTKIGPDSKVNVIKKVLCFELVENRGAVWGLGNGQNGSVDFLAIITVIIIAFVLVIYFKFPLDKHYRDLRVILVFIISGAIGNFIDRVWLKYVTDFIYIELIDFPVFNVADCYITLSCIVTIILILTKYRNDEFKFLGLKSDSNKETKTESK